MCNGSTADSDSVCRGSNPFTAAKKKQVPIGTCFFFILSKKGFEPAKVSAFGKCAGGTFSAESARAVPHVKRGVSRAESLRGEAAADGRAFYRCQKEASANRYLLLFYFNSKGFALRRFRRIENVPAARFQPKARGRYRTRSVGCPERTVCKRSAADRTAFQVLIPENLCFQRWHAPRNFGTFCPEVRLLAVLPQPGYPFSDGHSVFKVLSIDELP